MTKEVEGLSIIVPTYNEKDNIAFLLYLIKRYLFPLYLLTYYLANFRNLFSYIIWYIFDIFQF